MSKKDVRETQIVGFSYDFSWFLAQEAKVMIKSGEIWSNPLREGDEYGILSDIARVVFSAIIHQLSFGGGEMTNEILGIDPNNATVEDMERVLELALRFLAIFDERG